MNSPAKHIDHTLLKSDASGADIANLCEEAVEHGFASVCVPPSYVPQASQLLYGSGVAVCTVVGFPLGYQTTEITQILPLLAMTSAEWLQLPRTLLLR
jgi:deoxyribose-phosphate aldolase